MKKRSLFHALMLVLLAAVLLTCAVNPVTGKRELMLLSEADEVALGQQTDAEVIATYGLYEDAALTAYVAQIGQRMAALSHRPGLKYSFKVLDTPVVNAFAVPGGYVYMTRGIMSYLNDEAELAGVIGHELGHVCARHTATQYTRVQLAQVGLGLGSMLSEDFRKYAGIASFGVNLLFLRFSRDNERQADDLGVEYSSKSGYDSNAMAEFFNTLEQMDGSSSSSGLPEWFSTHPNPEDRIGAVRRKTAEWQQKLATNKFVTNKDQYLAAVDGMVYGDDPRQGYVDGQAFYHPTLKFVLPVPSNWTVNNTPSQLQFLSPNQDAAIMLTAAGGQTAQAVASAFVQQSGATVQKNDAVTLNGLPAQRVLSSVTTESGSLSVLSYFIQKDNLVYTLHGMSDPGKFSGYSSTFSGVMGQFKNLTDASKMQIKPTLLSVKTNKSAGTVATALRSSGVAEKELATVALLNGKKLEDRLSVNTKLKLISK